jgi:hypothetical protein
MTTKRVEIAFCETSQRIRIFIIFMSLLGIAAITFLIAPTSSYASEPTETQMRSALQDFDDVYVRESYADWGRRGSLRIVPVYFKKESCIPLVPDQKYKCTFIAAQEMVGPMVKLLGGDAVNSQMRIKREGVGVFTFLRGNTWQYRTIQED